jgi:hypothetical protein
MLHEVLLYDQWYVKFHSETLGEVKYNSESNADVKFRFEGEEFMKLDS